MIELSRAAEQLYWNNTTTQAERMQCVPYFRNDTVTGEGLFETFIRWKYEFISPPNDSDPDDQSFFINVNNEITYYRAYNKNTLGGIKDASYIEMVLKHWIEPMIIFVDNLFVPWSRIRLYDDCRNSYLLLDLNGIIPEDTWPNKIDIAHIPFDVTYTEKNEIYDDKQLMFIFDDKGCHSYEGHIRLYINKFDTYWFMEGTSALGRINRYDLDLDDKIRIYPSNVLVFKNGLLYREADVMIDSYNALYIDGGKEVGNDKYTYKVFRDLTATLEARNVDVIPNHDYLKHMEYNGKMIEMFKILNTKFDFKFDDSLSYDENMRNFLQFSMRYNYRFFIDKLKSSNMQYVTYPLDNIRGRVNENGIATLPYPSSFRSSCFPLIYIDGIMSNSLITRHKNSFELDLNRVPKNAVTIEILYFRSYWNRPALPFKYDKVNTGYYVFTNEHEVTIVSRYHPDKCFEMDDESKCFYTVDPSNYKYEGNTLTFLNDTYANQELMIVPKRRVYYERFKMPTNNYRVILGDTFNYANREDHYTVYINGRKINSSLYRVILPSPVRPFNERSVYFHTLLKTGDIVEVLYSPMKTVDERYIEDLNHSSNEGSGIDALGYITAPDNYNVPLSKNIHLFFVNGKKVHPSDIKDLSFSITRITKDIKSIEDLCIVSYDADFVEEVADLKLMHSLIDDTYGFFNKSELNVLTNTYTYISNAELARKADFSKEAIIHQIVKDYYTHVNKGVPFRYTYDKDTYTEFDENGNIILDVIDGTEYKSLDVKEAESDAD